MFHSKIKRTHLNQTTNISLNFFNLTFHNFPLPIELTVRVNIKPEWIYVSQEKCINLIYIQRGRVGGAEKLFTTNANVTYQNQVIWNSKRNAIAPLEFSDTQADFPKALIDWVGVWRCNGDFICQSHWRWLWNKFRYFHFNFARSGARIYLN